MADEKIALALYTIRDKLQTAADYARCLAEVRRIGYVGVEGSALDPLIGAREYRRILDGEGLEACSAHAGEDQLRLQYPAVLENARILGCTTIVYSYLGEAYWSSGGAGRIASFLDDVGGRLGGDGIRLLYHNHHMELARDGKATMLDTIYRLTDARSLGSELDTYWIQHGGGDPAAWLRKLAGRATHLHCKDKAVVGAECVFAEVGEGNLDWKGIVSAARAAGVRWLITEQDTCRADTLRSAELSYRNLRAWLESA